MSNRQDNGTSDIEDLYAKILRIGVFIGLGMLIITYVLYMARIMTPAVELEDVVKLWHLSSREYLEKTGIPDGWGWLSFLRRGDYINYIGISILASISIFCYIAVLPLFIKKKILIYSILVGLEIVTLVIAASGLVAISH